MAKPDGFKGAISGGRGSNFQIFDIEIGYNWTLLADMATLSICSQNSLLNRGVSKLAIFNSNI